MARLITKGKDYGFHPFFVQLRSLQDHTLLKGVFCGDLGPKLGYRTTDNGFLQLTNVRIPREQMLMKYTKVAPDGTYSNVRGWRKMLTANRLAAHIALVEILCKETEKALTIAIRYSAIRRQISARNGLPEAQILNHQVQQYRLFSSLSAAYCLSFISKYLWDFYQEDVERVSRKDMSTRDELLANTAGLKAFVATILSEGTKV
jgi:acyl-CoA oxidase